MSNSHRALGNVGHRLPAVFITRVLTWPGADTSHCELKPELRRGVQGTRGNLLVLAKKEQECGQEPRPERAGSKMALLR